MLFADHPMIPIRWHPLRAEPLIERCRASGSAKDSHHAKKYTELGESENTQPDDQEMKYGNTAGVAQESMHESSEWVKAVTHESHTQCCRSWREKHE